ncbi:FAD-dependent oxidoreductase [Flavilitoribacter nigricans]|uniref:FAD-binding dehydrogenase n=1 Tax=Flavilitoribacter nigricans (strain ATCC 23147 / DSM 23189 / NBRC 102662 / NCIMB 1420 / SS-2) TaxID=1122177 RepID=A0A2D0NII1_FLAN2|nr:FAD-dependent oxidoreductase [Flavilitoribacter nigricans]PHN08176.1 FAD-binding dehydrogenase [Flavilitoribacter nigricans DSM 23189 = NBRC 102662]
MIKSEFKGSRAPKEEKLEADLVIVGGGMSGVCGALTAARAGIKVVLVQDRPVLGGNASSEVRLWILGATSHMGNNNRWAREGGVIDEILVENLYRNKEGNPLILDTILLEKVSDEPNITLLLNTMVYEVEKSDDHRIDSVIGFCSQNSTRYRMQAPLFCDASGDGIIAFLSGASFRMGAEKADEFDEGFAPDVEDYGELLGHSIYFYTKDVGQPVRFVAPSYALKNAGELPRIRNFQVQDDGCRLWWVEYGGRLDTVHQSEEIKWELWRVIYGIWDHVKNSGQFPGTENLTLEWVGTIPGKRESRRFEGDYMLHQKDVVEQREHYDAVSFGGWSLDLHPADGIYSDQPGCNQWHAKGVYQIPYRCYYSKDIDNLFLAGRIISASHVAFGSSRVMGTCAHGAQAVAMAAVLAVENNWLPRDLSDPERIVLLQRALNRRGQSIPQLPSEDPDNLMRDARITADSALTLAELPFDGPWMPLQFSTGQMLPLEADTAYKFRVSVRAKRATELKVEWRTSSKIQNHTPDVTLETQIFELKPGEQEVTIMVSKTLDHRQYAFLCFEANPDLEIRGSETRISGILSVFNKHNKAVSNYGRQDPPAHIGIDAFEFWTPSRRPEGHNIAMQIQPAIACFGPENLNNGRVRPENTSNAYVADPDREQCAIDIYWPEKKTIREIVLFFDPDYDHPLESTLHGHPESVVPFCVRGYELKNCSTYTLVAVDDNHQAINRIRLDEPIETDHLQLILQRPLPTTPAALFEVMCF